MVDYTWFVDDRWAGIVSFLLTVVFYLLSKGIYNLFSKDIYPYFLKKNTKKLPNPKGGANSIDECIDPGHPYLIVDPELVLLIKRIVKQPFVDQVMKHIGKQPAASGAMVVSSSVFIVAYVMSQEPIFRLSFGGIKFYTDQAFRVLINVVVGMLSGGTAIYMIPAFYLKVPSVILALVGVWFVTNIVNTPINCDDFLVKLPSEKVEIVENNPERITYLDNYDEKKFKVYMEAETETTEKNTLWIPIASECSSEVSKTMNQKDPIIDRKCQKKYVPLKYRTKTLADLNLQKNTYENAEPYIQRYQERRERIRANRNK